MPQRAAFQRGPINRWRSILQDTILPLSTRQEGRDATEGLLAWLQAEELEGASLGWRSSRLGLTPCWISQAFGMA